MTSVNGDARDLRDARNVDDDARDDSDLMPDSAPLSVDSEDEGDEGLDPRLPDTLRTTLEKQGFKALTPVQRAVLDADLRDHDLRISSQTGSGKTVAIGIALYEGLTGARAKAKDTGRTVRAIAIVPTRELAAQVARELSWLYRADDMRVISVTGGTSVGGELRSLREGADIVVGTPGRLLDHLQRGAIDARQVGAVVLDEADQMLDFGFRDELEGILEVLPKDRRTHLCSATFSREVLGLANKFQKDAVSVEGTRLGVANVDIAHVAILVQPSQRADVLVNELLREPELTTLVFSRTRADAAELATTLSAAGFQAAPLTGDLEQRDRTRTLAAFRSGAIAVLVATDVAARGLDIPDVGRVIHADPPSDAEAYTHRSGRTGRAGKKGTSLVFVPLRARENVDRILRRARVEYRWEKAPTAAVVRAAEDARLLESLRGDGDVDERSKALADALLEEHEARALVAKLIARGGVLGRSEPRNVDAYDPMGSSSAPRRERRTPLREAWGQGGRDQGPPPRSFDRQGRPEAPRFNNDRPVRGAGPERFERIERPARADRGDAPIRSDAPMRNDRDERPAFAGRSAPERRPQQSGFTTFWVTWGAERGADPRRLLALVCRRGGVRGGEVGAIDVGPVGSRVEIAADRADEFLKSAQAPDAREPWIRIEKFSPKPRR